MGTIICIGRISRYVKEELIRRFGSRRDKIWIGRTISIGVKKGVWRRK